MKSAHFLSWTILLGTLLTAGAQSLTVLSKTTKPPEMDTLHYVEIQYGSEVFTMVPPKEHRMQLDAPAATLRFSSPVSGVSMTLQFSTNAAPPVLASADTLRAQAFPQPSDAAVREEFAAYSGAGAGKGLELAYLVHGQPTRSRVAVIPIRQGCVSFAVIAPASESKVAQQIFGGVLTSFQAKPETAKR